MLVHLSPPIFEEVSLASRPGGREYKRPRQPINHKSKHEPHTGLRIAHTVNIDVYWHIFRIKARHILKMSIVHKCTACQPWAHQTQYFTSANVFATDISWTVHVGFWLSNVRQSDLTDSVSLLVVCMDYVLSFCLWTAQPLWEICVHLHFLHD